MTGPEILVHAGADDVAEALTARLTARIAELQRDFQVPQICLTGGRIADRAYARLAAEGRNSPVDWTRLDLWWGDERFVAVDDADRNAKQALDVLTPALPLEGDRIHPMPASDSGLELDEAADAYDIELGDTVFDICLLGMGPDGHVASLFPDHPSASAPGRVIGVRNSPKPPPDRLSLTLEVINASTEVWFLVSGEDKAEAAAKALLRSDPVPAAGVTGRQRTVWLVDEAAAAQLPPDLLQRG
jgi:6-phosphogluconolactonase